MKQLLAFKLALIIFLSSVSLLGPVSVALAADNCQNGECIDKLIDKLEDLGTLYKKQCLPSEGMKSPDLKTYYEEHGLSESCWKLITEINHLETKLQKHQTLLEQRLGCESGECKIANEPTTLNAQLTALNKVEQNLSCTEPKKKAIKNQCPQDMNCALISSAMGVGGYLAEMMVPQNAKPKNCHMGDDSCATQLATGFLKAAVSFFEGAWDLMKMAGKKAGQKMGEFWTWVKGAENHSSTSQLAMAKASEDKGVFDMLVKDFPRTMKKIWTALVASLKEWMKTDILCQKWAGAPHFSKCLAPTQSFDCVSCKSMVNGLCAVSGVVLAEVVPAFLTGGLVTAAKYGASGATKIAKLFKVSGKSLTAVKNSRAAKSALASSAKVDNILKVSKGVKTAKVAVSSALSAIKKYLMSPVRKAVKNSLTVMTESLKKGKAFMADTGTGRVLVFSGKTLKTSAKIILYPIDNPMTTFAFNQGQRSFDKAFKLGSPKLAAQTAVTPAIVKQDAQAETLLARIEEAKIKKAKAKDLPKLEEELLKKVTPKRAALSKEALSKNNVDFNELIKTLYPELQYGELAKKVGAEKVIAAEKQLLLHIEAMPDGAARTRITKKYNQHVVQGAARAKIVGNTSPTYKQIIDNSKLPEDKRLTEALKITNRKPSTKEEQRKLAKALQDAHLAGPDNGVFEYSWSELREKYRILLEGGFTKAEADILIRAGLAGRPPVRELIQPGDTLFSGFAEDIVKGDFLKQRDDLIKLIKDKTPEDQQGMMRRLAGFFGAQQPSSSDKIIDNLESLYFVDYSHHVDELDNFLQGSKEVAKSPMSARYEKEAFNNFKATRSYLLNTKPEINKDTLLEVHRRMMKGGVEDVPVKDMGVIREGHWYGNVPGNFPIDEAIKKEVAANPYLTWIEEGSTGDGKYYGKIYYPNVELVKKEGLDLIRKKQPDLVLEIEEYQNIRKLQQDKYDEYKAFVDKHGKTPQAKKIYDEYEVLFRRDKELTATQTKTTQRLVDAMVDDLMDWFTRERTLIGDINTPEKLDQYVNIVAKFQRDLVSIHPLSNGNGRSTRELALSYALMKEGFPPPRIIDTNADIYRSLDDWKKIIKHGILASDFLVDDLAERIRFGLPIENSVDLITPYTRPPVKMGLKGQKKVQHMDGVEYIDPRLYREIVKREIAVNPGLKDEFKSNPLEAWDKIHKRAEEVFSKNNIYYNHPKKGIERVALNYVDEDFKLLFGKPSYNNKELYDFKMKTWYSNDITWRGLASKHAEKSESEIVQMFSELTSHNASNAVLGKIRGPATPEAIKKAALEDFDKYNNDVFGNGLVQMARDHSETGPMYGISYGYSTSKNRDVGKAFAMGAMVVGEYGAHKAPELQALLKSRVLVGARRANKDVDLGRLKQVREEFSYKYGRQQEVMGIGASDPDAITIVQTIDAKGDVMTTYLRNKNNPKELYVIKGDIDPEATPDAAQIIKTISLGSK